MSDKKRISVIIPIRNAGNKLRNCLDAVTKQSRKPDEIIVVDGDSTDDSLLIASKYTVRILHEGYHNRAGGCQVGLINSIGDYIAFTDSDCIPDQKWLENLERNFEGDDNIGLAGATIFKKSTSLMGESIRLALSSFIGSGNSVQYRVYGKKRRIRCPSGCNSIYRRSALDAVGGFDTRLSGGEDEEISKRLSELGYFLYIPDAWVHHDTDMVALKSYAMRMMNYGKWGAESSARSINNVVAYVPVVLLITISLSIWIIVISIAIYILITLAYSIYFSLSQRRVPYIWTIPIVYALGHIGYVIGYWKQEVIQIAKDVERKFNKKKTV